MRTLEDIKRDKEMQSIIGWWMKPEDARRMRESANEMENALYWCIRVQTLQHTVRLILISIFLQFEPIAEVTEIPKDMLIKALKESGGDINKNGDYPIDDKIREWLMRQFAD